MSPKDNNQKFIFTKRGLLNLALPAKGCAVWHDTIQPGLCLRLNAGGRRVFFLQKYIHGRSEKITIGEFPAVSVDQARRAAARMISGLAEGKHPGDTRRALRAELTFSALFHEYLERHAKRENKPRSYLQDEQLFKTHLKPFYAKKISAVTRKQVEKLHEDIGQTARYAANRTLSLVKSVYNKAILWGYCQHNPAVGVKKFREVARDRFLNADELQAFFQALSQEPNPLWKDFFLMLLLTGARRRTVQQMRWDQIDFNFSTWRIPDTKSGEPQSIPLCEAALELLEARRENGSPWVFPHRHDLQRPLEEPRPAFVRIIRRAGIQNFRIHDMRRTMGSWMASAGISLPIIGKALGHKSSAATEIYSRVSLDPVRASMESTSRMMLKTLMLNNEAGGESDEETD